MKLLRLVVTEKCFRSCVGCCMKDYNIMDISSYSISQISEFDQIFITGGEPLLNIDLIKKFITKIRKHSSTEIYLYTALIFKNIVNYVDGVTYTIHKNSDLKDFKLNNNFLLNSKVKGSFFLNVFHEVNFKPDKYNLTRWNRKKLNITWVVNSPLPNGETLGKHILFN